MLRLPSPRRLVSGCGGRAGGSTSTSTAATPPTSPTPSPSSPARGSVSIKKYSSLPVQSSFVLSLTKVCLIIKCLKFVIITQYTYLFSGRPTSLARFFRFPPSTSLLLLSNPGPPSHHGLPSPPCCGG